MDRRSALGEFLRTRRARRQPGDLGLPPTPTERRYLHNLARPPHTTGPDEPSAIRPNHRLVLDNLTVPAAFYDRYGQILAWNSLAAALLIDFGALPPEQRNMARLVFLDEEVAARFVEWDRKARDLVSQLRMETGRTPDDPQLAALVGELTMKSPEFARLWASHRVREKTSGHHRYRHPVVGEFVLGYEAFHLPDLPDVALVCQFAQPGTPDEEAMRLLASWSAEPRHLDRVNPQLR